MKNPSVRSAIARIYFETIYLFEDGNDRIGRSILRSLSRTIEANRNAYYDVLKVAQDQMRLRYGSIIL